MLATSFRVKKTLTEKIYRRLDSGGMSITHPAGIFSVGSDLITRIYFWNQKAVHFSFLSFVLFWTEFWRRKVPAEIFPSGLNIKFLYDWGRLRLTQWQKSSLGCSLHVLESKKLGRRFFRRLDSAGITITHPGRVFSARSDLITTNIFLKSEGRTLFISVFSIVLDN